MDSKKRSWVKAITWRMVGIVLLGSISYLVTGDWKEMSAITLLFHGIQTVLYYYHERLWEKISWGRAKHPLANIPVCRSLDPEDLRVVEEKLKALGYIE